MVFFPNSTKVVSLKGLPGEKACLAVASGAGPGVTWGEAMMAPLAGHAVREGGWARVRLG